MAQRTCSVEGCDRPHYGKGLCARDYQRKRKTGSTDAPPDVCKKAGHPLTPDNVITDPAGKRRCKTCREEYKATYVCAETCNAPGCDRPVLALGLCNRDYQRVKIKGTVEDPVYLTAEERVEHQRAASRRHYWNDPEHVRAMKRARYELHADVERERNRRYGANNRERIAELNRRWREANPERMKELRREWGKANPDRIRAFDMAKKAKRRMQIEATQVEDVDPRVVIDRHGMVCHICTDPIAAWSDLHFDHVIPLARGGSHTYENIRPSHSWCNQRKGTKLMSEIRGSLGDAPDSGLAV